MDSSDFQQFPWPMILSVIGFAVGFVVQFRLKHHVDREKVIQLEDMSELFPNSIPPKKILNKRGQQLYRWFYAGIGCFAFGIVLTVVLYGKR